MTTTTHPQHPTAALRWAPVLSAAYAQATAFAAASMLAFLIGDLGTAFESATAARLWPLGAFGLGLVAAINAGARWRWFGPAQYTGSAALAGLTLAVFAAALAPNLPFMIIAALAMGAASGLVIAVAGKVVASARSGNRTGAFAIWGLAALAGVGLGLLIPTAFPEVGWRGAFGLVVVAAALATWKFAEHAPRGRVARSS